MTACEGTFKGGQVVCLLHERMDGFDFFCCLIAPFAKAIAVDETGVADWRLAALAFKWREREMLAVGTGELFENGV